MDQSKVIVFGGGCFWCTEASFNLLKGVIKVTPGYAGGQEETAFYDRVSGGETGHAEVVKVEFDPQAISLEQLLDVFFTVHDPTTLNRQGADIGSQYRSIIFVTSDEQSRVVKERIAALQVSIGPEKKVVTKVELLDKFYTAEDYHQRYFDKHEAAPYCSFVIAPKLEKISQLFPHLLK